MSLLSHVPLFTGLGDEEYELLEQHTSPRNFQKNAILVSEGDMSDSMFVVLEGRLKVFCSDDDGREVTLNDLNPGDYFGEIAMFDGSARSASVVAMTPCKCLIISKAGLIEAISKHPELAYKIIGHLTFRIRELTTNVKNLALMDVYGRITNTLLQLAEPKGDYLVTAIPLTQQEIANRVGASREMVARIMKDLEKGNYIEIDHKHVVIKNSLPLHY